MSLLKILLVIAGSLVAHVLLAMLYTLPFQGMSITREFRWLGAGLFAKFPPLRTTRFPGLGTT